MTEKHLRHFLTIATKLIRKTTAEKYGSSQQLRLRSAQRNAF
jgi:hypothetical protein